MGLDELPNFHGVGELFIDGIKVLVVSIVYAIIPLIFCAFSLAFGFLKTEISLTFLLLSIIFIINNQHICLYGFSQHGI